MLVCVFAYVCIKYKCMGIVCMYVYYVYNICACVRVCACVCVWVTDRTLADSFSLNGLCPFLLFSSCSHSKLHSLLLEKDCFFAYEKITQVNKVIKPLLWSRNTSVATVLNSNHYSVGVQFYKLMVTPADNHEIGPDSLTGAYTIMHAHNTH